MSKHIQEDINRLLHQIDQGGNRTATTEEMRIEMALSVDETGTSTLHLFLLDEEEEANEEENAVEGSLEEKQSEPKEESTNKKQAIPEPLMSWESSLWARVVGILGLLIFFAPALLVPASSPVLALPITVVIQPTMEKIGLETTLTLQARRLEALTLSQTKTKATTGRAYQPASKASGRVTLYNALPTAQYIQTGTLITASSGIQVATDQGVTIPGGDGATNGQANVSAHALVSGPDGNIGAYDINGPCCLDYTLAKNPVAFSGGQDEKYYQTVTEQDIDKVATDLKASLRGNVKTLFEAQLQTGEILVTPSCQPTVNTDHKAGDEAKTVKITVEVTCMAWVYSRAMLQQAIEQRLDQDAIKQLGASYKRVGDLQLDVLQGQPQESTVVLQIKATGSYAYQFSHEELEELKRGIVGKSKRDAIAWLKQQGGVQMVTIDQDQLPRSATSIQFLVRRSGALGMTSVTSISLHCSISRQCG